MNMEAYNKMRQPPKSALKEIKGGRLKGMTDINPQWRYEILTEVYGPCGIGWKFTINRLWTEPVSQGQVFAFAEISLYIYDKESKKWSDAIPGIGGSSMITLEKSGLYSSDECFKMAVTDALSTASKMLGVAADIYAGKWDGSKYKETEKKEIEVKPFEEYELELEAAFNDGVGAKWWTDNYKKAQKDHPKDFQQLVELKDLLKKKPKETKFEADVPI